MNPMREIFANLPFYITFSEWIKKSDKYDREESFARAFKLLGIDQDRLRAIELFRTFNNFDRKLLSLNLKEFSSLPSSYKSEGSEYAKLFLNSIPQIFKDYEGLLKLITKVKKGEAITNEFFSKFDWFPTKIDIPRYFNEIVGIIEKRIDLISSSKNNIIFVEASKFNDVMSEKYKGKQRLNISQEDENVILDLISSLIKEEQRLFVEYLNTQSVSLDEKFKNIFRRRVINRFSIN